MRPRVAMAVRGVLKSVKTIKMEKIWRVEPVMYIPIAFMGSCFAGAMAISHAFFNFRVSVSSVVGGLRTEACGAFLDCERCFALSAAVKPGGSGIEEALGLAEGALLRSSTHLGVGGGCAAMVGL